MYEIEPTGQSGKWLFLRHAEPFYCPHLAPFRHKSPSKIYRTRDNRRLCKKHGIRLSGPPLGRPKKVTESNKEELQAIKRQQRQYIHGDTTYIEFIPESPFLLSLAIIIAPLFKVLIPLRGPHEAIW